MVIYGNACGGNGQQFLFYLYDLYLCCHLCPASLPDAVWKSILKVGCNSLDPYKIIKTIAQEAEANGISPSIAVARYKHEANWYKTSSYRSPKIQ